VAFVRHLRPCRLGLAKLTETSEDPDAATATLPAQEGQAEEGVILGTIAYISPEQAEGRKIDARSDIFSFGSVLCEMVTGRRAFEGETGTGFPYSEVNSRLLWVPPSRHPDRRALPGIQSLERNRYAITPRCP
jgi:serine/threonine protein kinase